VTIADFVADLRAPTPSAAAELISRNQLELLRQIQSQQQRLEMAMDYYLAQLAQRFTRLNHRLQQQHPHLRLARQQTALFKLRRRLDEAMQNQLRQMLRRIDRLQQRLNQQQPQSRIHRAQQRVQQLQYRLQQALALQLSNSRQRFGTACTQLEAVSPLATLARGYSVTTTPKGELLKKTTQTAPGDTLKTRLADGWIESEVKVVTLAKKTRKPAAKQ
ncbi:MAG: exodeoxyribonuclease VII large subunit, partial [Ewingella sp.]|nr:exodeoxyribonuclease VII large subunit [Ewingella sp.]